jgi:DNA-binding transcriptional LysR family regulator
LYAWEFEKGKRQLRVHVEGQLVFNGTAQMLNAALGGFGLAYVPEDLARPQVAKGRLKRVLEDWCPPFSGYHLYYPSHRQPHLCVCVAPALSDSLSFTPSPMSNYALIGRVPAIG